MEPQLRKKIITWIPAVIILLLILIFYLTEGMHLFSFERIREEYFKWRAFVHESPVQSAAYFIGIYILSVLLVIPDSTFLTLLGGLLFPMPLAIIYACVAETLGATLFFWAAKLAFIEVLGKPKERFLSKLQKFLGKPKKHLFSKLQTKFHAHPANYLLFFRLSHLLPFWVINACAGIFRAKTRTFIWTTAIGVLPLTFFLVDAAKSLSKYLETHTSLQWNEIFTLQLKISLISLGFIALLPVLYQKFRKKR